MSHSCLYESFLLIVKTGDYHDTLHRSHLSTVWGQITKEIHLDATEINQSPQEKKLLLQLFLECSQMVRKTGLQSQAESYKKLKIWYLMPHCLTLNIIKYRSKVSGAIQRKELHHPLHLGVVAIEKGALVSLSSKVCQLTTYINIYTFILKSKSTQMPITLHCDIKYSYQTDLFDP